MKDLFHAYAEKFLQGDFFCAINLILPHPDTDYDILVSEEPLFNRLVNYVDASLFGTLTAAYHANLCLYGLLSLDAKLASRYSDLLSILAFEQNILELSKEITPQFLLNPSIPQPIKHFLRSERLETSLRPNEIQDLLEWIPSCLKTCFQRKLDLLQGWVSFKASKCGIAQKWFNEDFYWRHPWYPLQYDLSPHIPVLSPSSIPVIFLQPLKSDLSSFLETLNARPALFVFETKADFLQVLQFPDIVQTLISPLHLIYILDSYPHEQFLLQPRDLLKSGSFQPIQLIERKDINKALPAFIQALSAYCTQPDKELHRDNELGNWLYQISQNLIHSIEIKRLGVSRAAAYESRLTNRLGYDHHKGLPAEDRPLGILPPDYLEPNLKMVAKEQITPRRLLAKKQKKWKLAHITTHIVDGTAHAPSRLIENLVKYHDKNSFDLHLILTEMTQFHPLEYPITFFNAPPSTETAPHRLKLFEQHGASIHIVEKPARYVEDARWIAELLHLLDIDIAVFHGCDIVNTLCAQLTDAPLRVYFEHGVPPAYPLFDLAILTASPDIYRDQLNRLGIHAHFLPFAIDVTSEWGKDEINISKAALKENLGFPADSSIMTTISNNLDNRLSDELCEAIAEILQKVPTAYYAPIGFVRSTVKFKAFFKKYGVDDRVVFLGYLDRPSRYARCMDIYLNEFPVGSGVSILDAMACGCPVVSMYDQQGAAGKRYGGLSFFGVDRCIASCKKEDYVALACRLLTDPKFYQEWSHYAKQQYEKHSNPPAYTKQFETFLLQEIALLNDH